MKKLRSQKGVTLTVEVLAVVLLLIIISSVAYSSSSALEVRNLNRMYSDIVDLQAKATTYYLKNNGATKAADIATNGTSSAYLYSDFLPVSATSNETDVDIDTTVLSTNPKDVNGIYLKIDTSKLSNLTLNYEQTSSSYYFINTATLTVYYSKGVDVSTSEGTATYYTMPSNYQSYSSFTLSNYQ